MMRTLLLLLLLTTRAIALDTTTAGFFPSWGGVQGQTLAIGPGADVMRCWTLPARIGITNFTKMAAGVLQPGASGCVASWTIYSEDGLTKLASFSASCATAGIKTGTVSAISLTQGTNYSWCYCASKASVVYLAITENATASRGKVATHNAGGLIASSYKAGTSTLTCTTGIAPALRGTLDPAQTFSPPLLRLEQ